MQSRQNRNRFRSVVTAVAVPLNVALAMLTVLSAFGGTFDPDEFVVAALMAMALPVFLIADVAVIIADFVFGYKRLAWVIPAGWLVAINPLLIYCPLNIFPHEELTPQQEKESFTFMTYNVMHYIEYHGNGKERTKNMTYEYILEQNPDVVNLQEAEVFEADPSLKITQAQLDSIKARYPYCYSDDITQQGLYSKFPFTVEELSGDQPYWVTQRLVHFTLDIRGRKVSLFNVHLQSIGLTPEDKQLYVDIMNSPPRSEKAIKREITQVKNTLISKLAFAFGRREAQARYIRELVDEAGPNVIVAGDFNDIQGCYAERIIMGNDLHDAYAENGFGPCVTYHDNRFWFRIDHILFSSGLDAVGIKRGKSNYSDHSPMLTKFVFTDTKK